MHRWKTMASTLHVFKNLVWWPVQNMIKKLANFGRPYTPCNRLIKVWMHSLRRSPLHWQLSIDKSKKVRRSTAQCRLCWLHFEAWWINLAPNPHRTIGVVCNFVSHLPILITPENKFAEFPCCIAGAKLRTPLMSLTNWCTLLVKFGSSMTSYLRSRHSRSPRGPNDIQYQLAQFPCGAHNPQERERVCRELQTEDIDLETHILPAKKESSPRIGNQPTNGPRRPDKHILSVNAFSPRILAAVCPQQTLLQHRCSFRATAYPEHLREIHHPDYLTPPTSTTALKTANRMISSRTLEMYVLSYMTGAQESFGYFTKAWTTTKVDSTVSCPVISVLRKRTASPIDAVNVFDHAYQNKEKLVSDYIINAFVKNISINEDHRPAWIQPEEHMSVRSRCTTPVFPQKEKDSCQ